MVERGMLNAVLSVAAVAVLVGSGLALALASAPHGNDQIVIVNDQEYSWEDMSAEFEVVGFEANGIQYEGVRMSDVVNATGLANPETYEYEIVSARDGYSKTFAWVDLLNGYMVVDYEKRAVFPDRTKSFWIDTVGEINPVD